MKIGDKVRLLKGHEEGIITNFLGGDLVEIEIEDGFKIPVLKKEVVVVSREEETYFGKGIKPAETFVEEKQKPTTQEGVFIGFVEINDKIYSYHLINNTSYEVPYVVSEAGALNKGIASGLLPPFKAEKVGERFVQDFENWPILKIQLLFFKKGNYVAKEPLAKSLKFKVANFYRSKRIAPVLSRNAFLFQVDADAKPVDSEVLKEQMFRPVESEIGAKDFTSPKPVSEVDLHIEKLEKDHKKMSGGEILEIQLKAFEKHLDQAIAYGLHEITFIHGIGNNVLKNAIQKKLSNNSDIKYYKDARKEKFGYGATLVGIK